MVGHLARAPDRILIEQTYPGPEDDRPHFDALLPAFRDPRYVRIGGRPIVFVYQPGSLPDPARFVETWQTMAGDAGLGGLYLVASLGESAYRNQVADGFDAGVLFRYPFARTTGARVTRPPRGRRARPRAEALPLRRRARRTRPPSIRGRSCPPCTRTGTTPTGRAGSAWWPPAPPRSGSAPTSAGASSWPPASRGDEQVLVVKSWNEWAEGNYLEPDRETGTARLEALRRELLRAGHLDR